MRWLALALAAALAPSPHRSASPDRCDLVSVTPLVFSGYSPFGPGVAGTFTIHYACPPSVTAAWIGISGRRTLRSGNETLSFELYRGPDRTAVWPESPPVPVPASSAGAATVYAFLPPQDAAAGTYGEHANLTVEIYGGGAQVRDDAAPVSASAVVAPACTISPATLAFGSYDPLAPAPLDAQGTIEIACTRGTAYAVALDPGAAHAGTRHMASGGARLAYELYVDPGRTAVWTSTTTVTGSAPSVAPIPLPVYGRIPAGQGVAPGAYSDVVQSTIQF